LFSFFFTVWRCRIQWGVSRSCPGGFYLKLDFVPGVYCSIFLWLSERAPVDLSNQRDSVIFSLLQLTKSLSHFPPLPEPTVCILNMVRSFSETPAFLLACFLNLVLLIKRPSCAPLPNSPLDGNCFPFATLTVLACSLVPVSLRFPIDLQFVPSSCRSIPFAVK